MIFFYSPHMSAAWQDYIVITVRRDISLTLRMSELKGCVDVNSYKLGVIYDHKIVSNIINNSLTAKLKNTER